VSKLCAFGLLMAAAAFLSVPTAIASSLGVNLLASYYINIASFWFGIAISVLALARYLLNRKSRAAEN
jgi:hypothetical protein